MYYLNKSNLSESQYSVRFPRGQPVIAASPTSPFDPGHKPGCALEKAYSAVQIFAENKPHSAKKRKHVLIYPIISVSFHRNIYIRHFFFFFGMKNPTMTIIMMANIGEYRMMLGLGTWIANAKQLNYLDALYGLFVGLVTLICL